MNYRIETEDDLIEYEINAIITYIIRELDMQIENSDLICDISDTDKYDFIERIYCKLKIELDKKIDNIGD